MENNNLIDEKYIKIGQKFIGRVNGSKLKIVDIFYPRDCKKRNLENRYVRVECENPPSIYYGMTETNVLTFRHLLLDPIIEKEID